MKRTSTRVLSWILTLAMILTLLPVMAFAADATVLAEWKATALTAATSQTATGGEQTTATLTNHASKDIIYSSKMYSAAGCWILVDTGNYWQFSGLSSVGYTNLTLALNVRSSGTGPAHFQVEYSTDGTTYTKVEGSDYTVTGSSAAITPIVLPVGAEGQANLSIRLRTRDNVAAKDEKSEITSTGTSQVQNVVLSGTPAVSDTEVAPVTADLKTGSIFKKDAAVRLACETAGAAISYNFTAANASDWAAYNDTTGVPLPANDCTLFVKAEQSGKTASTAAFTYNYVTPTTITAARTGFVPDSNNTTSTTEVCVEGVVTFTDGRNSTIQDASGAIGIDGISGLEAGTKLLVSGVLGHYSNWVQIKNTKSAKLGTEALPTPVEKTITELLASGGALESQRVKIVNALLGKINTGAGTPLTQDKKTLDIYKMPALGNDIYEGFMVDAVGILGVFGSGFQLRVNSKADVTRNADFTAPTAVANIVPGKASGEMVIAEEMLTFTTATPGAKTEFKLNDATVWTTLPSAGYKVPTDAAGEFILHMQATRSDLTAATADFTYMAGERQVSTIETARRANVGTTFKVTGTVTWVSGQSITIQDATGGIVVRLAAADTTGAAIGKTVTATGVLADFKGMLQLTTPNADFAVGADVTLPAPQPIGASNLLGKSMRSLESQRVQVRALKAVALDPNGDSVFADAAGKEVILYKIPAGHGLTLGNWYAVTGIVQTLATTTPGSFGGTVVTYTFSLRVPSADCFTPTAEPANEKVWNVVQFSAGSTIPGGKDDPVITSVAADLGEYKAGATATIAEGKFESGSGGHTSKSWDNANQALKFKFSTVGFENLDFTISVRASGTGPRDIKLQYSTDGTSFTDVPGGKLTVLSTEMQEMTPTFKNLILPAALDNQPNAYLRLVVTTQVSQAGKTIASGGAFTYAGAIVSGTEKADPKLVTSSVPAGGAATGTSITLSNAAGAPIQYRVITEAAPDPAFALYTAPFTLTTLPATVEAYGTAEAVHSRTRSFAYTPATVDIVKSNYYSGKVVAGSILKLTCATDGAAITYDMTTNVGNVGGTEATLAAQTYTPAGISLAAGKFPIRITATASKAGFITSAATVLNFTEKMLGADKLYFGQLHSHTGEYSDGSGTLAQALEYAKTKSGTDFVAFTDHSNYMDSVASLGDMTDATKGLRSKVVGQTDKSMWQVYTETINAASSDDFIAIPGYEMTWSSGPGHINTFGTTGVVSRNNAVLNNKTNDAGMQAYYDLLKANPQSISQFNHPGNTFGTFADFGYYTPEADAVLSMVEVGNGEGLVGSGGYFPSYQYYDMALSKGWHVAPTNNQDNHKGGWGNANTSRSVVLTDDFSTNGIYQSMRDMRMYATEDQNLAIEYTVNGQPLGTILPEVPATMDFHIKVTDPDSEAIGSISIITEGGLVLKSVTNIAESSYTWDFTLDKVDYAYYYVRVNEGDKDIAVTAPVWAGTVKKLGITSLSTDATSQVAGEKMDLTSAFYNFESTPLTVESIAYALTRLGETKTLKTLAGQELTDAGLATIIAGASKTHLLEFTPTDVGLQTVSVTLKVLLGGVSYTLSKNLELEVIAPTELSNIAIDGGHANFYVTGDYANDDVNFIAMAGQQGIRTTRLAAPITYAAIKDMKLLVLTVPYRGFGSESATEPLPLADYLYTEAELNAIAEYAAKGGNILLCSKSDRKEPVAANEKANVISNAILAKLGAKARIAEGLVVDDTPGLLGNNLFRLYFTDPKSFNTASPFTAGVLENMSKGYSAYNAAPILLNGATPLVKGHSSTFAVHHKELTSDTVLAPNQPVVIAKGETVVMSTETLSGGGFLIVSGTAFFSNKEIESVSGDDREQPYVNALIAENMLKASKPAPTITPIATLQNTTAVQEGEKFTIEGIATTNASGFDQRTAFFDCIYVQDATGGINVFPVDGNIQAGQTVQITGYVASYLGERQLQARSVTVIDPTVKPLPAPKIITTAVAASGADLGLRVQVAGTITAIEVKNDMPEAIMVRDESGTDCRVFIDGYITPNTAIENLVVGYALTAVGLSSNDTVGTRIRISNRADIVCTVQAIDEDHKNVGDSGNKVLQPSDIKTSGDTVTVTLSEKAKTLSAAAQSKLITANADKPIVLSGAGLSVTIPKGALKKGADVNALLVDTKQSGNAIRVTHADGTTAILPFSVVGSGSAAYLANLDGSYKIIDNTKIFPDLAAGFWGTEAVDFVSSHELFQGVEGGKFAANNPMTRAMLVTVLARLDSAKPAAGHSAFPDVAAGTWYAGAVSWAAEFKLVEGDGTGFNPNGSLTREQLCTILARYLDYAELKLPDVKTPAAGLTDMTSVNTWAADAVARAIKAGLIAGKPDGRFDPQGKATRAEIATILQRFVTAAVQ